MKLIAIMQPTYLPWIGYFDLIDQVDQFVFLDDVQLVKRSWQVRNRIKTPQGALFLSVPIKKKKHRNDTLIKDTEINYDEYWTNKHLKSLEHYYKKTIYFDEVFHLVKVLLLKKYKYLANLNIDFIQNICVKLKMENCFLKSSELEEIKGNKDKRLTEICIKIGAKEYLSPQGSAIYIEKLRPGGEFPENNIKLFYHNYEHPVYKQLYGNFKSKLCILDLLFNYGFQNALEIIRKGRRDKIFYKEFRKVYFNKNE